jgi:hypothetical protein
MLAAQAAAREERPQGLLHKLSRLLNPSTSEAPPLDLTPAMTLPAPAPVEAALWLTTPLTAPSEPAPAEILLGDFCPRRPAFGQRTEPAHEPARDAVFAPAPFMAPDREVDLGILLQDGGTEIRVPPRRRMEPLHTETPFFPEDLADDPQTHRPAAAPTAASPKRPRVKPKAPATAIAAPPAPGPPPELAGVFLLATLAARLASEEQSLRQSLGGALRAPRRDAKAAQGAPQPKATVHRLSRAIRASR